MHRDTPLDLQPTKDDMKIRCIPHIAIFSSNLLDAPEPSVENKHITFPYALVLQMSLCRSRLAERRLPVCQPGHPGPVQVGVKMRIRIRFDVAFGQITDNSSRRRTPYLYLLVSLRVTNGHRFWDR